jgi:hypothetical protein
MMKLDHRAARSEARQITSTSARALYYDRFRVLAVWIRLQRVHASGDDLADSALARCCEPISRAHVATSSFYRLSHRTASPRPHAIRKAASPCRRSPTCSVAWFSSSWISCFVHLRQVTSPLRQRRARSALHRKHFASHLQMICNSVPVENTLLNSVIKCFAV